MKTDRDMGLLFIYTTFLFTVEWINSTELLYSFGLSNIFSASISHFKSMVIVKVVWLIKKNVSGSENDSRKDVTSAGWLGQKHSAFYRLEDRRSGKKAS